MVSRAVPWEVRGLCADSGVDFFSEADLSDSATEDEIEIAKLKTHEALSICSLCPVRRDCITSVLKNKDRFGVWGGANQDTIREALCVDVEGNAVARSKNMICPYCKAPNLEVSTRRRNQIQINCTQCLLTWWAAKPVTNIPIKVKDVEDFGKNME